MADRLCYHYTTSGEYSVKSGSRIGRWLAAPASSLGGSSTASWWKCLWGLNFPQKIKVFLWRTCNDWISTKLNLVHKGIGIAIDCLFRCEKVKSTLHACWGYATLKTLRKSSGVLASLTGFQYLSCLDFLILARC
ncbi:hypothetical protein ACOSQ2_002666 [Xanthoceras sorbifolium]